MKYVLATLAASFALATPALAQDHHRDRDRHHERDRDWDRGDRWDRRDRDDDHWDRRDRREERWERRHWRRGERMNRYDYDRYHRVDYRRHHLRQPPRGMVYLMDDYGNILLVVSNSNVVIAVNLR